MTVEHCPAKDMIGDFMSKPLQGKLFKDFKTLIMGNKCVSSPKMQDDRSVLDYSNSNRDSIRDSIRDSSGSIQKSKKSSCDTWKEHVPHVWHES